MRITSTDLAAAKPAQAIDGVALTSFDPFNAFVKSIESVRVERIVVLGLGGKPKKVEVKGQSGLEWDYVEGLGAGDKRSGGVASVLTIKNPSALVTQDWEVTIHV